MKDYVRFLWRCFRISFVGTWQYYVWMLVLTVIALVGINAYCKQLVYGLVTTGMTDHVSWGLYIANFTYLVGMAAAAVMLVIPVYIYRNQELHHLVIFGELLSVAAIVMCLLFVNVDLGRPDRFMHIFWRFNFPISMLTWDVVALGGYLLLNMHICGYLIYCDYRQPQAKSVVLRPVRVCRHRLGDQHPHGHGVSVRRPRRPAFLELGDHRAAFFGFGVRRRPGVHHPDAPDHSPLQCLPRVGQSPAAAPQHRHHRADRQHVLARLRAVHRVLLRFGAYGLNSVSVPGTARVQRSCALDLDCHRPQYRGDGDTLLATAPQAEPR